MCHNNKSFLFLTFTLCLIENNFDKACLFFFPVKILKAVQTHHVTTTRHHRNLRWKKMYGVQNAGYFASYSFINELLYLSIYLFVYLYIYLCISLLYLVVYLFCHLFTYVLIYFFISLFTFHIILCFTTAMHF